MTRIRNSNIDVDQPILHANRFEVLKARAEATLDVRREKLAGMLFDEERALQAELVADQVTPEERHAALVQTLRKLQRARTRGSMAPGQLSVRYLFYDESIDAAGTRMRPCLLDDPEFPAGLDPCVKRRRLT